MVDVAVVGAAGYTGIEAVRWVLSHPRLSLTCVTSAAEEGRQLSDLYPALVGKTDLSLRAPSIETIAESAQIALLAVPHTAALALAPSLLDAGLKVVDLSADFRLRDVGVYEQWYGVEHTSPELLEEAVYGLPELDRSRLPGARLVAVPGCYPTATTLAALPALEAGVAIGSRVIVDAKSGVSGAGRTASAGTHFCTVNESMAAYKVASHRHTPEIEQNLSAIAGRGVGVSFTPHLVPMTRGLLSTVYLEVEDHFDTAEAVALYRGRYHSEPFVHVHPAGSMPSTAEVEGTNSAAIGVAVDERTNTLIATCVIDNLGKGASGQGIQCLNAVLGFPETEGLDGIGAVV